MSFQGKKNVYVCPACGHGFVSLDVDAGTTPFMTACINDRCSGSMARSFMYNVPQEILADVKPALEWYLPSERALRKMNEPVKAHVRQGGLVSRRVSPGKPAERRDQ